MSRFLPLLCLLALAPPAPAGPIPVRLERAEAGWRLLRDGKPYFVRGAGGAKHLKALAGAGGNSVRTWGADDIGPLLDEAHRLGLSVAVGLWLGHERHGFSYNDADQVADQAEKVRRTILRHRDHPAVLLWGIGNEMEGYEKGDNAAIWSAVNNLAGMAKKLDPHHPTMTVIAEIGGDRVKNVHRLCPDIDIVGINSYAGAATLPRRYHEAGGTKPYILTEFGPPGSWEVGKTGWGAAPEPTSSRKGDFYRGTYEQAVLAAKGLCLGSYAFLWGNKQEATATWFGMLLPDGRRLAPVDVMTELWSGKPPANRCPVIEGLTLEGADQVEPGATLGAKLSARDPEEGPLTVRWVLQAEPFAYGTGGDAEEVPPTYPDALLRTSPTHAQVRMPKGGGGYRLFVFVEDAHGGAATANIPLLVKGPRILPPARAAALPLVVHDEAGREAPPYVPSGWMGNTRALRLDEACADRPHAGKTCLRIDYQAAGGWGGIVWQHPAGDWGDRPGGWDLTGARRLTFWARGAKGGEVVTFEVGILEPPKLFHDTARFKLDSVRLTGAWQKLQIDLSGKDLSRIKTGFVFTVAGGPVTFYLDDIRYE